MTDDIDNAAATDAAATELPAAPNTAAAAVIAGAVARRPRGRPPKNPAAAPAPAAPAPAAPAPAAPGDAAAAAGAAPRKKKPSGKKKTRAELLELVKQYQKSGAAGAQAAPAPGDDAPAAHAAVIAGDDAAKAKFAAGVARLTGAVSRFVARRRGVHWQLDAQETAALGECTADCLEATEEMAPSLTPMLQTALKLAPFAVLAAASYEIIDSRLEIDAKIAAGAAPRIMPATGEPAGPRRVADAAG